jgi:hypothetical protein
VISEMNRTESIQSVQNEIRDQERAGDGDPIISSAQLQIRIVR